MITYLPHRRKGFQPAGGGNGLLDSLVAYWAHDETTIANHADSHAGGLTLTNNGAVTATASGKINHAASFAGAGRLSRASSAALQGSGTISFAGWAFLSSTAANQTALSKWGPTSGDTAGHEYAFRYNSASSKWELLWYLSGGGSDVRFTHSSSVSGSTWYFFAFGRNHGSSDIWISINAGAKERLASASGNAGAADFGFGALGASTGPYNGRIDETGVWSAELSGAQLAALYNGGSGLPYSSFEAS